MKSTQYADTCVTIPGTDATGADGEMEIDVRVYINAWNTLQTRDEPADSGYEIIRLEYDEQFEDHDDRIREIVDEQIYSGDIVGWKDAR